MPCAPITSGERWEVAPYLATARGYWWLLAAVLLLVWGSGLAVAYDEYSHTYQSEATIWTQRVLAHISPVSDPGLATLDAPATEQSDALRQLLQTRSFLTDVVSKTSLRSQYEDAADRDDFLADVGRRFRVQRLGTNLVQLSYRAAEPRVAAEMVQAALDARIARIDNSRLAETSAADTFLQREYETAKSALLEAQRQLDLWARQHRAPLDAADDRQQRQLTLSVELAQARALDVKARIDRAPNVGALQQVAQNMDFQVIDQPRPALRPSGGLRPAATTASVAGAIGLTLIVATLLGLTLLPSGLASEGQLARLAGRKVIVAIPAVRRNGGRPVGLRDSLAADVFDAAVARRPTAPPKEP
jgi:uncharacterized protein involved in exopolysaccharide biosynthesis